MERTRKAMAVVLALGIGAGIVSGCGDDGGGIAGPGRRTGIDPRSYYEDYEEGQTDSATAAPQAGASAEEGSAVDGSAPEAPVHPDPGPVEPGFLDDNTFTDPGDNPFVAAADDPVSTFGLDIDTGSFTVGRTFLEEGYLPDPDSVRTEEWVNAFDYAYPEPEGDRALGVQVDTAAAPFEDGAQLVRVASQAATVSPEERPDAAITLVVDTSGSMDIRERLGLVRSTLALLAVHLRDTDTVAVVTFEDEARTLLPPTPVAEVDRIVATIEDLTPEGSTNMEAGLRQGYELAGEAFREDALNTVVLASDGVANQGMTEVEQLADLAREKADEGIRLVTVGYGMGNYRDDLMEQLADQGDGFYSYVDTYEEAERLFSTELTTTLTVVAAEARAQVSFDPAAVAEYRLVGYENRVMADDDFRDDAQDTGELGSRHAATALYEVRPVAGGPGQLGEVTLRHRPVGPGGQPGEAVEQTVPITGGGTAAGFDDAPADLRLAATVAAFAELMAEHPLAGDRGVTLDRIDRLVEAIEPASGEGTAPGPDDLAELIELARDAEPPSPPPVSLD